jgi:hypothetical protein
MNTEIFKVGIYLPYFCPSLPHQELLNNLNKTSCVSFLCYFDRASLYRIISLTNFNAQFSIH